MMTLEGPALILVLSVFFISSVGAVINDGVYVSNGTDILFIENPNSPSSAVKSIYKQRGSIAGLAYDKASGYLFWSTIDVLTRGIYRATLDDTGKFQGFTKIIDNDIVEVNCLTYDWVQKHIYWTDSQKKTVEVAEADGSKRKILIMTGLLSPRGIYADPINGYLFWTDQGHKHIARSSLDGSSRQIIVSQANGVSLPNQMVVSDRKLYWVDSDKKTFESSNLDGGDRKTTSVSGQGLANNEHIFGLTIDNRKAYITNWKNGQLITVDVDGRNPAKGAQNLGKGFIFSAIAVRATLQPPQQNPCTSMGCEGLCLPVGSSARCTCPSYGAKTLGANAKACTSPSSPILVYAVASNGYVCFRERPSSSSSSSVTNEDIYVVGRSLRPVAVSYDPTTQFVYWSDVRERSIHVAKIDGTNHRIILGSQQGIGLVEGMVVDVKRRQLYYTNIGSVMLDGTPYSWHRIETIGLDTSGVQEKVKTIVTTADKPRGIVLDSERGHLYYTDWGSRASIVRVNLDGSDPTLIRTGLDNPNGITIFKGKLYFVDSHYKTRQLSNDLYPTPPKNGSLYSMTLNGTDFKNVLAASTTKLRTPFGLTAVGTQGLCVSDWDTLTMTLLDENGVSLSVIHENLPEIMSLYSSEASASPEASGCRNKSCSDICLSKNVREVQCTCNSYGGKPSSADGLSCSVPSEFIVFADMNSIKLASLDGKDSNPYVAVQGSPYFANYAGLTYDAATKTVYFSDVYRKAINALNLGNMTWAPFYRVNEVIDGLVFHERSLYWSDFTNGRISVLQLTAPGPLKHRVLIDGLKRPRGIKVHGNYIYWTEWGDKPRVARRALEPNGASVETILDSELIWPNGIHIDESNLRLYAIDGNKGKIFNCSLSGGCQELAGIDGALKHAYDIWMVKGVFYYSDWKTGAINAYHPGKPGTSWTVVGGLMRPTQMFINSLTLPASNCPSGACTNGECVPLLVNPGCDCTGKVPSYDKKICTAAQGTCSYNGQSYNPGKNFKPGKCVECQCVGRVPFLTDPVFNNSVCQRMVCPELNCDPKDIKRSDTDCCQTCTNCGVRITNCPKEAKLTLPSDRDFVVYEFLPTVKDCLGLSREISITRSPSGTVYRQGPKEVTLTVSAKKQGNPDVDSCRYSVVVTDTTPPTIRCPKNEKAYITGEWSSVSVQWNPPEAFDNVNLADKPKASKDWGSNFTVGSHTVTYTATDTSGLSSSCSFNVTVEKLASTLGSCRIPRIMNGDLSCSTTGTGHLVCSLSCDAGYTKASEAPDSLDCMAGIWNPAIKESLLLKTCLKEKKKTLVGHLKIVAPDVCARYKGLDYVYTKNFLQGSLRRNPQWPAEGQATVTMVKCDSSSKDLIIDIEMKHQNSSDLNRKIMEETLANIKSELEKGFLKVAHLSDTGVHNAKTLSITAPTVTPQCLPGETSVGTDNCKVCSIGTKQDGGSCEKCEQNFYNDVEGQTQCKSCPGQTQSDPGSFTVDQCKAPEGSSNFILLALAGLGVLLLIVLIIVLVLVIRKRGQKGSALTSRASVLHHNKTYQDELDYDNAYDKIAELPLNEAGPSNQNHYETLDTGAAAGADVNYDTINKEDEKRRSQPPIPSENNSSSETPTPPYNSSPSYLTPIA